MADVINGRDTISAKEASVYKIVDGEVIPIMECTKLELQIEKKKEDIKTLGSRWVKKKTVSIEGTGSLGAYWINSNWIKEGLPYAQGKRDTYFEITATVEDDTTDNGRQTIHVTEVNLDKIPVANLNADDSAMQFETDLTFEGIELVEEFNNTTSK